MVRQAVVVIHGMGEQRPLDTLTRFVDAALEAAPPGTPHYYSRPESVTGSFESRRFLAPRRITGTSDRPQTEFFEYHWSDKMQGNRLDDLWPTFRRMMLCRFTRVPAGLRGVWLLGWALILWLGWAVGWGPLSDVWRSGDDLATSLIAAVVSSAALAAMLSYVLSRLLPAWLTTSFVDVVRYLDTSPRSYGVRRDIRKGLVEMLQALHEDTDSRGRQRYQRVVIVAHSLGAYIAYDAVAHLWGLTYAKTSKNGEPDLAGLEALESAAAALPADGSGATDFQATQTGLFDGLRDTGNPWLISDFISVGTPMYFADRLLPGRGKLGFEARKSRHELPTCPPLLEDDGDEPKAGRTRYSWRKAGGDQVLHQGAPFAVVRWTNLYFPTALGFFGDWFGGPLVKLFGPGVRDVPVTGNRPWRHLPAVPHSLYFRFPGDTTSESVTTRLREAMTLARPAAAPPTPAAPTPPATGGE